MRWTSLVWLSDLTREVFLFSGQSRHSHLAKGQRVRVGAGLSHKRMSYETNNTTPRAQGPSQKRRQQDCKSQKLGETIVRWAFVDQTAELKNSQLWLPVHNQASQQSSMEGRRAREPRLQLRT